jgi:hypothetical protein
VSAPLQTVLALGIVAAAIGGLAWRAFAKRGKPGCGSGCGCATDAFKAKLKR